MPHSASPLRLLAWGTPRILEFGQKNCGFFMFLPFALPSFFRAALLPFFLNRASWSSQQQLVGQPDIKKWDLEVRGFIEHFLTMSPGSPGGFQTAHWKSEVDRLEHILPPRFKLSSFQISTLEELQIIPNSFCLIRISSKNPKGGFPPGRRRKPSSHPGHLPLRQK